MSQCSSMGCAGERVLTVDVSGLCFDLCRSHADAWTRRREQAQAAEARATAAEARVTELQRERDEAKASRGRAAATAIETEKLLADALGADDDERAWLRCRDRQTLLDGVRSLRAERDEARANYQFMVDRVADQKLDGYRELGQRAADAENERDTLRAEVAKLRAVIAPARGILRAYENVHDELGTSPELMERRTAALRVALEAVDKPDACPGCGCHLDYHRKRRGKCSIVGCGCLGVSRPATQSAEETTNEGE